MPADAGPAGRAEFMNSYVASNMRGVIGAIAGGVLGIAAMRWASQYGLYGPMLPGGLLGLGCAVLARHDSLPRGLACGVLGLVAGLLGEWWSFPFRADAGLGYFLTHVHLLKPLTWVLIGVGAAVAFWVGRDHFGQGLPPRSSSYTERPPA